jgi:hypothetical protein
VGVEEPGSGTIGLLEDWHLIQNGKHMASCFHMDLGESAVDHAVEKEKKEEKKNNGQKNEEEGHERKSEVK